MQNAISEYVAINGIRPATFAELATVSYTQASGADHDSTTAVAGTKFTTLAIAANAVMTGTFVNTNNVELDALTVVINSDLAANGSVSYSVDFMIQPSSNHCDNMIILLHS